MIFPKKTPSSARYILTMYIENGRNKKVAAMLSGVGVRRVQQVTRKYDELLETL